MIDPDLIVEETQFWRVTTDNQVIWPLWENIEFSQFWLDYFQDDSKFEFVNVGRGGGKTFEILLKALIRAVECYCQIKAEGKRYTGPQWHLMLIFPTQENAAAAIQMINEMLPKVPGFAPDGNANYRHRNSDFSDWRLFGNNELLITVYSTYDANTLRGKSADQLVIDEAFNVNRADFIDVLLPIADRPGRPPIGGFITAASTPDTEQESDPWFDAACDEADPSKPDAEGYFSEGWTLWQAPFSVNATLINDPARFERILKQSKLNPLKWQRERLAIRGLKVYAKHEPGQVFTKGMIEATWYMEKLEIIKQPVAALDLAFGSKDSLARIWYDAATGTVYDLDIWLPQEQQHQLNIKPKAYDAGIVKLFQDTNRQHPGCIIVYDANSENYMPVSHLVPRTLRTYPVRKNNHSKNGLVSLLSERFTMVDENGRNRNLRLPHPEAPWLTDRQRKNFERLYRELYEYVSFLKTTPTGETRVRYNKPDQGSDDAVDALLLLMTQTKRITTNTNTGFSIRRGRKW